MQVNTNITETNRQIFLTFFFFFFMANIQEGPYYEEMVKHCLLQFLQNWAMSRSSSKYPWPSTKMPLYWLTLLKSTFFFFFFNKLHLALNLVPALPGCWHSKRGQQRDKRSRFLCIELCPRGWTANDQIGWIMTITVLKHNVKCVRQDSFAVWASSSNTFHLMLSLRGGKISWPSRSSLVCVSQWTLNLSANSCWWRHYNMRSLATTISKNPAARHHESICFLIG